MIHGSRDRSNGLVIFPRSQMIHDLLDDLIRPAPGGGILFSGHNYSRNQSRPRRREDAPIMDRRKPRRRYIFTQAGQIEPTTQAPESGLEADR